ncbi:hypothetical protein MMC34_004411 [Xylographa carneopallida]|nr:hypothetical protein [Xylographa carneopallida]
MAPVRFRKVAANADFPPSSWLGFGLNYLGITPGSITSVTKAIITTSRHIKLDKQTSKETVNGVTWKVPYNVDITTDTTSTTTSFDQYKNGTEAAATIEGSANAAANYLCLSGSAGLSYSITKTYQKSYAWALYSFKEYLLQAQLVDFGDSINESNLTNRLSNIDPFDSNNPSVVNQYKVFFDTMGTHVVVGATYGASLQMSVYAANSKSEVDEKFAADVHAQYNGLTNGGKFDAEIKSTSQFKEFETLVQKSCDCFGGDPALALEIACAPENGDVYKYFTDWNKTAVNQPNVMSMETMAIWELMSLAADPKVYKRVDDFSNAYKWISSNPGVYITKCRFTINSDWGEIGLLTPSAFIEKDPASPPPTDNVNFQTTKVSFGREHSYQFKRDVIVDFVIRNDGSPVDICLSHGSDGATKGSGACSVVIQGTTFDNKGVTDNFWNTVNYYQCEVNPTEDPGQIRQAKLAAIHADHAKNNGSNGDASF